MIVKARQSFQFLKQMNWFIRNNETLSKFRYWILLYQVTKNQPVKANFMLTLQATLIRHRILN